MDRLNWQDRAIVALRADQHRSVDVLSRQGLRRDSNPNGANGISSISASVSCFIGAPQKTAILLVGLLLWITASPLSRGQEISAHETSETASASESVVRSVAEIHQDLRRLEFETAKLKSDDGRAKNILALCRLFVEIGEHPDIVRSPTLQSLSVRLRTRLRGIDRRTVKELRKRQIPAPQDLISLGDSRRSDLIGAGRAAIQSRGGPGFHSALESHSATRFQKSNNRFSQVDNSSTEDSVVGNLAGQLTGSAGAESGHAAPGPDYGWQLVNLIRHIIQPDYWSVAGGPGKAIYFGHSRALVIHGSWRVQEDVADLLSALRGYH